MYLKQYHDIEISYSAIWRIMKRLGDGIAALQSAPSARGGCGPLFDHICRENGVDHILTQPRSPTTTGKIERFHRSLRVEFNTNQVFRNLKTAPETLDEWVSYYNTQRPHQALADATRESRFRATDGNLQRRLTPRPERKGEQWVCRKVASNEIVSVGYQQVSVGEHHAGSACDVLVTAYEIEAET